MAATVLDEAQTTSISFGPHTGRLLSPQPDAYFVSEWTLVPGTELPGLHAHARIVEEMCIVSGRVELTDGQSIWIGEPGTFVHIEPGTPHGFGRMLSDEPVKLVMVMSPGPDGLALVKAMSAASGCTDPHEAMALLGGVDFVPYQG